MIKPLCIALLANLSVVAQLVDFAPHNMTNFSSPSPYVVSASAYFYQPYYAFNGNPGANGWNTSGATTGWIELDFGAGNTHTMLAYAIYGQAAYASRMPSAWNLQGSNDNSTWSTLDTESGVTNWSGNQGSLQKFYICSVRTTAYRYFRVNVTANNGDGSSLQINQLYFYGGSFVAPAIGTGGVFSPTNMTDYTSNLPLWVDSNSEFGGADPPWWLYTSGSSAGPSNIWVLNSVTGWEFLDTMYPTGVVLASYKVTAGWSSNNTRAPKAWTMQCSNDNNATWTALDTQTNQTGWSTSGETRNYNVSGAPPCRSFRLNLTANNGDGSTSQISKLSLSANTQLSFPSSAFVF